MLTLHHLNNSRSQRVLWLMEELGLKYEIKYYQRDPKTMLAPPELKEVHPLGKSPVIQDGDLIIAESGAIIEYLVNKYGHGKLKPTQEKDLLNYHYFLHYAEGSLTPILLLGLIFSKVEQAPWPVRPIAKLISAQVKKAYLSPNMKTHFEFLEAHLTKHKWFAGEEISAADIQMSFPIEAAASRKILDNKSHLKNYLTNIHARPAYKKALEIGGDYPLLN